jgi:elongation factor Ts
LRARTQAGILNCKKALEVSRISLSLCLFIHRLLGLILNRQPPPTHCALFAFDNSLFAHLCSRKAANGDIERAIAILKEEGAVMASKKTDKVTAEGVVVVALDGRGRGVLLEINCQTDFAARGESFKALAPRIARAALTLPASVANDDVAALNAAPLAPAAPSDPADSLADQIDSASVAAALTSLTARIGEAVRVRRFTRIAAPAGDAHLLAGYAHGGGGNGILPLDQGAVSAQGRSGSLVLLELLAAKAPAAIAPARAKLGSAAGKLAQHIVGFMPQFVSAADITDEFVAQRREMAKKAAAVDKNADDAVSRASRESIARDLALLEQPYPVEAAPSVSAALAKHAAAVGIDSIAVRSFARYECGDGIVKEQQDYAAEVAKLAQR